MGTVGDEVVRRINAIEASLDDLQNRLNSGNTGNPDAGFPMPPSASNRVAMDQLAEIRRRLEGLENNPNGTTRLAGVGGPWLHES